MGSSRGPLIAIVAGETSGDQLGAGLTAQLKLDYPQARIFGIGGPKMQALGFESLYEMDDISMIGLEGVFTKLPKIIRIRRALINHFLETKPDVFIGIDVPDFNLGLEKKLTNSSINCIHYVSPTIWAWRSSRIKTIKQAVKHMLVLFPFEVEIYKKHEVPVTFVGHPIANELDLVADQQSCRETLGLNPSGLLVAMLPGSRQSEIQRHAHLFLETAQSISQRHTSAEFVISAVNQNAATYLENIVNKDFQDLNIRVISTNVRNLISASDLVLAASGTVTLETALMQKPLVMAYKVSWLSELMVKCFSKVEYYAMPNFLLDTPLVPEFVQDKATVENLAVALSNYIESEDDRTNISNEFKQLKELLSVNSNVIAANVVKTYLGNLSK